MRFPIVLTLTALVLPVLARGDLADNQIEDTQVHRGSLLARGRPHVVTLYCSACGPSECQVMGMQRYSEPRCEPFGGEGSPCRMWQEPENKTLHFPDTVLHCNDVYMQFCPCARGLVCDEAQCKYPQRQQQRRPLVSQQEREERESFDDHDQAREEEEQAIPIALEPNNRSKFPWAVARFH